MNYQPRPLATDTIELSSELIQLTEQLAENAHELWAIQHFADGWIYGEHRDDKKKTHPCLVPYHQLPDSEKEYDRKVAMGTLKAIVALKYTVVCATATASLQRTDSLARD